MTDQDLKLWAGLVPLIVILSGCGGDPYRAAIVTGRVLCNGKPATGGVVQFEPMDLPEETGRPKGNPGRGSTGIVREDGAFSLVLNPKGGEANVPGALIGPHRVTFALPNTKPFEFSPEDLSLPPEHQSLIEEMAAQTRVYEPLDCAASISPSKVTVRPGINNFEFVLDPTVPGP